MKILNESILASAAANANQASAAIAMDQIFKMSAQVVVGTGTAGGSVKLQVSNDAPTNGKGSVSPAPFVPTNWSDLGSPVTITTSGVQLVAQQDMSYRWLRAIFSDTVALANTVVAVADVGVLGVANVSTVADVSGSLNNTYFTFSLKKNSINYYVWYNINGAGVDPALPGKTGIEVDAATDATADTIASATRTALAAVAANATTTGATNHAIITQKAFGPVTAAADGAVPTGFGFSITAGVASNLNNSYFLLQNGAGTNFYVWFNVGTLGTDPALSGKTGIAVAIAASASAATVGAAIRGASITGVTASGSSATAILTNDAAGPATPASDGAVPTGFAISSNNPTASISVNIMCLSA